MKGSGSIKVPCSSANIGPGFDTVGISLSIYLTLNVRTGVDEEPICQLSYEGEGADEVPLDPEQNLITRTALYVLKCHNITAIPKGTRIHINNGIPLGRGLGSSGAAVVAGVMLGDMLGGLKLSKERMMDYCLMIERHPDNVMAAMMGGFVGSFLNELSEEDTERKEIPLSEVLPEPAGGIDTGLRPPEPPTNIGHHITFGWAKELRAIAIIPQFEVSTAKAREVLPTQYSRSDLVFNLQRLAVLTTALARSPPNPDLIHQAMQDRVHQPYRKTLIPGLPEVLASVTPKTHPGLCGICLSGAGPTILALATRDFDHIAQTIMDKFKAENITCTYEVLEPAYDGATASFTPA
ncbi:GHMP kinase [Protomyces lactucae-debilis]|uniref:Homoserine kinase n=1 Tax=Protomyces lactucae-debilis TaxID=2754530 RepID=A0A1Y2FQE8_PROLT|nr:GHMP kinase [Protomyces lactucae-debilis]ORY86221.1 GHMP kinase [Protomyces lactucae-debilis]